MSIHLCNGTRRKLARFVHRFGLAELFLKPLRLTFAPLIIPFLPNNSLNWQDTSLPYFYHRYNTTWANERCIEVPIARWYLARCYGGRVLEVGNVLAHYFPVTHEVVDKFEHGPRIINQDIVGLTSEIRYDLIISISTFEHIGFDENAREPSGQKIRAAFETCRSLLQPHGKLVLTVPVGYNPKLDTIIAANWLSETHEFYFRRTKPHYWEPCSKAEALTCRYGKPFAYANAIVVAEIVK